MRLKVILTIVIIALAASGFAAVYVLKQDTSPEVRQQPTFPGSTSLTGETVSLARRDGSVIATQNFIQNGVTIQDAMNPSNYILAGDLGYCLEDGSCPTTGQDAYTITYFAEEQAFMIGLGAEPLGETRRNAEQTLLRTLGVSEQELCKITVSVGTTVYVNETYGSMPELGLSFCPNAVPLP